MLRLLFSLTLAVLLCVTGAASMAHGLASGEAGHHAMEGQGDEDAAMAALDECCDATGAAGGGCLIDAALVGASVGGGVAGAAVGHAHGHPGRHRSGGPDRSSEGLSAAPIGGYPLRP